MFVRRPDRQSGQAVGAQSFRAWRTRDRRRRRRRFHVHSSARCSRGVGFKKWIDDPGGDIELGDCFGEMSLLTGEKRSATVRADGDCYVMEISKETMAEV